MRSSVFLSSVIALAIASSLASCASEDRVMPSTDGASSPEEIVEIASDLAVRDVGDALRSLRERVDALGGRVESSERHGERASIRLRVPDDAIEAVRGELDGLDPDRTERESRLDVARTHTDLSARLRSARATEERLLALIAERTATLADVLAAETELARVRTTIEQSEGEERTLVDRITFASLDLTLTERAPRWRDEPLVAMGHALSAGVEVTWTMMVGLLVIGAACTPALACVLALGMLLRAVYRRLA